MTTKKKENGPKHIMGKNCGYTLFPDGSIEPAPAYSDEFDEIQAQEFAVDSILGSITRHINALSRPIQESKKRLWERISFDYGLDTDKYEYRYSFASRKLTRRERPDKQDKS